VVYEHGTRAIHRRDMRRPAGQTLDGACKLAGLPDIVLVAKGIMIKGKRRITGKTEEVLDEALTGSVADVDRRGAEPVLLFRDNSQGLVAGAVVRNEQPPILESLSVQRGKLSRKKSSPVIRTEQYGDTRHKHKGVL